MNPESSDSLHISIEGEILFPHGSPQNQSTKKIKTNDELNQKHRSRRAFSFSKFIGSTLDDKNEDKKEFQYTTNEQTCDQAPAIQSHFKWIQPLLNFRTLFKTRKKAVSLPEKERTVLISEHDSQKEAMFSCYNAFKNTEIQTTLDSLKESIDSDLLQKSTIRLIHYKHQDGVSKPLKPLNKPWIDCNNKENRQLMIKAESDKNLGKNVNKMSENSQAANVLASKQIRADKGDRGLMPDPLNTESISRSFYEQKVYMAGDDTSANCAPGIYLNSEISRLFNSLRAKADHEKSRFYVATNAKSHTFPDFELASQISINEISERSLSEEDSTNGPLSSFIEDPAKEISERCDHKQSRSHSSLANYYGKSILYCQAY
ncbi:hypothetical protein KL921_000532 [Ogataea angusta]|uniref:Uncharacterized protein n=1 Tax=Pichia angusta TaxID=870730 RepID=A0AAN6DJ80_PICAN|nr:uncharacterized protein KL928_000260 [Ogataea angusta]KAG7814258.1 hypothetical protein KL921_000532 [Ogataea angusta]KAG7821785.1 hypothetical protein KL928_000260 [Ogataea angusta]KAG7825939.1 hypothetical protein KL909_001171 [Ogataea angusta]KAG7831130.1 hypothetical protein KL920_000650 [Ogataea angusta]KAG7837074.1 hypothetical protein KL943_001113 [Ogataea angusta]